MPCSEASPRRGRKRLFLPHPMSNSDAAMMLQLEAQLKEHSRWTNVLSEYREHCSLNKEGLLNERGLRDTDDHDTSNHGISLISYVSCLRGCGLRPSSVVTRLQLLQRGLAYERDPFRSTLRSLIILSEKNDAKDSNRIRHAVDVSVEEFTHCVQALPSPIDFCVWLMGCFGLRWGDVLNRPTFFVADNSIWLEISSAKNVKRTSEWATAKLPLSWIIFRHEDFEARLKDAALFDEVLSVSLSSINEAVQKVLDGATSYSFRRLFIHQLCEREELKINGQIQWHEVRRFTFHQNVKTLQAYYAEGARDKLRTRVAKRSTSCRSKRRAIRLKKK